MPVPPASHCATGSVWIISLNGQRDLLSRRLKKDRRIGQEVELLAPQVKKGGGRDARAAPSRLVSYIGSRSGP